MKRLLSMSLAVLGVAGCASQAPSKHIVIHDIGNIPNLVQITDAIPPGATDKGRVVALFCDVRGTNTAVATNVLMNQLKVKAHTRGADGVAGVQFKTGGDVVSHNCKTVRSAFGEAYSLPKKS